mmetsp:Transcript_15881/g.24165  ORF Transcript_15881/g.24165 Transcript_15881/m.24165 type:complete len:216 (+) Transcript_15881:296-943(+)
MNLRHHFILLLYEKTMSTTRYQGRLQVFTKELPVHIDVFGLDHDHGVLISMKQQHLDTRLDLSELFDACFVGNKWHLGNTPSEGFASILLRTSMKPCEIPVCILLRLWVILDADPITGRRIPCWDSLHHRWKPPQNRLSPGEAEDWRSHNASRSEQHQACNEAWMADGEVCCSQASHGVGHENALPPLGQVQGAQQLLQLGHVCFKVEFALRWCI